MGILDLIIIAHIIEEEEEEAEEIRRERLKRKRNFWVHDMWKKRRLFGQFQTFCTNLHLYPSIHYDFYKMNYDKFESLLEILRPHIQNARAVASGRWQHPAPRARSPCASVAREHSLIPCSATNTEVMEMDEEKLIYLVQMYDCLYNINSRHYSDKHMKNNAWQKVGAEMNMSVEDCQKSWKKLRDSYRKGISLRESRSGSARTVERTLKFEKELEFIKPFIKSRKQISNLTSSPEESDITTDGEYQTMSPRPQSQLLPSPRPQSQLSNRTSSSNEQPFKMSNLLFKQYIEEKQIEDDPTISFFLTMGRTVKTMPNNIQAKLKGEIFRLINEMEIRLADDTGDNITQDTAEFNLSATGNNTTKPSSSKYPLETTSISPRSVTENYNDTNIPTTSFSYTPSIIPAAEKKSITSFSYKPSKVPSTSTSYQETNTENIYETNSPLPIYSNSTSRSSSFDPPPSPYKPHAVSKSQQRSSDSVLREEDYETNIDTTFDY